MTDLNLHTLLKSNPSAPPLQEYIASLVSLTGKSDAGVPDIKSYSNIVYFNYYALGISFSFIPSKGFKLKMGMTRAELKEDSLVLDGIDVYNVPLTNSENEERRTAETKYSGYPATPLTLHLTSEAKDKDGIIIPRPSQTVVTPQTTGKEFVQHLGEPDKKGGGAGPSSGSIGIFCSWSKDGIMVEFGGQEAIGPQAWDRGKDAVWKVITVFPPET